MANKSKNINKMIESLCDDLVDLLQRLLHEVEVLNQCVNSITEPEKNNEKVNKKKLYIGFVPTVSGKK
jgi:hypothetical protein